MEAELKFCPFCGMDAPDYWDEDGPHKLSKTQWRDRAKKSEAELAALKAELTALHNQIDCERMDPNGTIWEHHAVVEKENAALKKVNAELVAGKELLKEVIGGGPYVDDDGMCSFCSATPNDSDGELDNIALHTKGCEWRRGKEFLAIPKPGGKI